MPGSMQKEFGMADLVQSVADHLRAQRETGDELCEGAHQEVPDRARVLDVLDRMRRLLLDDTPDDDLASDVAVIHGLLTRLVGPEQAGRIVWRIPDMRHCVSMDIAAAYEGDPAAQSCAEIIAAYPSTMAVSTYRIAHGFYDVGAKVVARIMSEDAHSRTGIDIHPGADIGCHFFIDHGTGVVIGETTVIGNRVKLYHGVTLGAFSNRKGRDDVGKKRHPTIEDDVTIYPNATILGGETVIGEGAVIGGNAWVVKSVPPRTRVVIEPPSLQLSQRGESPELDYSI